MNRRELLLGAAAMAATATAGQVLAATHDHAHVSMVHDHHGTMSHDGKLIAVASDCIAKANLCLQHCLVSLGKGDKELAACAQSSSQVISMCNALLEMSAANSKYLPQLAKVAMDVCKECEEECKKTEQHPECKACKEACAACYEECKKVAV